MTSERIVYNFRVDSPESLVRNNFFFRRNFYVIYVRFNYDRLQCQHFFLWKHKEERKNIVFNHINVDGYRDRGEMFKPKK